MLLSVLFSLLIPFPQNVPSSLFLSPPSSYIDTPRVWKRQDSVWKQDQIRGQEGLLWLGYPGTPVSIPGERAEEGKEGVECKGVWVL